MMSIKTIDRSLQLRTNASYQELNDRLTTKLCQTKALLLVGSDTDFSSYHSSIQEDFFGVTLEYIEEVKDIFPELMKKLGMN